MIVKCLECGVFETNDDGNHWMHEDEFDFCGRICLGTYLKKIDSSGGYQFVLSFSAPANPEKTIPFKRTFTPLEKVPDPVAQEAFATLRQKDEVEKAPPIPLREYFSLVKRGIPIPPVTTS